MKAVRLSYPPGKEGIRWVTTQTVSSLGFSKSKAGKSSIPIIILGP